MTLNKMVFFVLIGIALSSRASTLDNSLCENNSKIFFSCTVSNGKKMSLCGIEKQHSDKYSVFYRYGQSGHIEMAYPSNPTESNNLFTYVSYHRYQVEYSRIYFKNGGYLYTIYRDYDGGESKKYHAGVVVKNIVTEKQTDFQCSIIHENNMFEVFDFLTLAEDPEL